MCVGAGIPKTSVIRYPISCMYVVYSIDIGHLLTLCVNSKYTYKATCLV